MEGDACDLRRCSLEEEDEEDDIKSRSRTDEVIIIDGVLDCARPRAGDLSVFILVASSGCCTTCFVAADRDKGATPAPPWLVIDERVVCDARRSEEGGIVFLVLFACGGGGAGTWPLLRLRLLFCLLST
jgi:hypothetical protein